MNVRVCFVVAVGAMGIAGSRVSGAAPSFQGLGDLPGGDFYSAAHGVSSDGSVVVGASKSASGSEAIRWENGVTTGLGVLPGATFLSVPYGVSPNGSVVVGISSSGPNDIEAFRWEGGVMTGLGDVPGGDFFSAAEDASADGSVVVGWGTYGAVFVDCEGLRWDNGVMTRLGDLPGGSVYSAAQGVSADGSVVVGYSDTTNGYEAFRWEAGVMTGLGDLPGGNSYSMAYAVSADASVIVGYSKSANGYEACRWDNGLMTALGDLPGGVFYSAAYGVSADGSVVVGRGKSVNGDEPFIWTAGTGMVNLRDVLVNTYGLDLTGWTLTRASDISDDAMTIVGRGTDPNGYEQGWIARVRSTLTLTIKNANYGNVSVEPNLPEYPFGTVVTLTAEPNEGKSFKKWRIWDPNYPGDSNHARIDSNNPIGIVMDGDYQVKAFFKCGGGVGPLLLLPGTGALALVIGRRTQRKGVIQTIRKSKWRARLSNTIAPRGSVT